MASRVVMHPGNIRILYSHNRSPVVKWMNQYALRVQNLAKGFCPADTSRLRNSITHEFIFEGPIITVRIGTNVFYARWVHDGTGLYGPRGQMIVPVNKKVLRWPTYSKRAPTATVRGRRVGGSKSLQPTGYVFSMHSRGTKGRPFLAKAMRQARVDFSVK